MAVNRQILSLVRLPIPPQPHEATLAFVPLTRVGEGLAADEPRINNGCVIGTDTHLGSNSVEKELATDERG